MKKGKSFICSVLEVLSVVLIVFVCLLLTEEFWIIFVIGLLIGATWLFFENLEAKGAFTKTDQKIYDTAFFKFLKRYKNVVYVILFTIAMMLTVLIFM